MLYSCVIISIYLHPSNIENFIDIISVILYSTILMNITNKLHLHSNEHIENIKAEVEFLDKIVHEQVDKMIEV